MKTQPPQKPLANWPPTRYQFPPDQVAEGDSWVSLASKYGRQDPWDIIQFNFETKVPEIVNHYLATLVGCTKSKDGKNYSFSSADRPGKVYIPPAAWTPAMGPYRTNPFEEEVLGTLRSPVARVPGYNQGGVVELIRSNINVVEYKNLWVPYEYGFADELYCRKPGQDFTDIAWLVKEAVHIWNGPYGWNQTGQYLQNEVRGWIALAACMEGMLPSREGDLGYFQFLHCTEGYTQAMDTFKAARAYLKECQPNKIPSPSTAAIERCVRRDPNFARRSYLARKLAAS